jgi:hypothetical protein
VFVVGTAFFGLSLAASSLGIGFAAAVLAIGANAEVSAGLV